MLKATISVDLSGFTYDPESPTINIERLAFAELQVLQALSAEGFQFRQVLPEDIMYSRSAFKAWKAAVKQEGDVQPELCGNEDYFEVLSCGIDSIAPAEATQNKTSIESSGGGSGGSVDLSALIAEITSLKEAIDQKMDMLIAQEPVLRLSDGTKILWKSQMVDS